MKKLLFALILMAAPLLAQAQPKKVHLVADYGEKNRAGRLFAEHLKQVIAQDRNVVLQAEEQQGQWVVMVSFYKSNIIPEAGALVLVYESPAGPLFHQFWPIQLRNENQASEAAQVQWAEIVKLMAESPSGAVAPAPAAK